jgi:hypothetical protein
VRDPYYGRFVNEQLAGVIRVSVPFRSRRRGVTQLGSKRNLLPERAGYEARRVGEPSGGLSYTEKEQR